MSEIIIYTNETCQYCTKVKDELEKQNIKFLNRLTSEYPEHWNDISQLTGIPTVPTVCFRDNYLVSGRDFRNPEHLIDLIKKHKFSEYSVEVQALEKLKTLNYNISMAFARLDQTIKQIEKKLK